MAIEITMPQLSDTMHEGKILTWHKKIGDTVGRGDALAEVATDKADLEIESFHEGTLLEIHSPEGTTVQVGQVIAIIGEAGEAVPARKPEASAPVAAEEPARVSTSDSTPDATAQTVSASAPVEHAPVPKSTPVQPASNGNAAEANGDNRVKISPLAKNIATSFGVDFSGLQGSGDGGRIVKRDIERQLGQNVTPEQVEQAVAGKQITPQIAPQIARETAQESAPKIAPATAAKPAVAAPAQPQPVAPTAQPKPASVPQAALGQSVQPLSRMRQTIATRMVESVNTAPHFYVTGKIHADPFIKLRQTLKSLPQYEGVTFNHLVVKAAGLALRAVPRINAFYDNGSLVQPGAINIGIITALEDGLLIPVVKNVDSLALADVVQEANGLIQRARSGRPKSDDLVGGTFSISNIGKAEVDNFSAIINPGQGAILAVSSIQEEPIVLDGQIAVGNIMRVTLSVDHRIIDGVVAGQFVTELKRILEEPVLLLA